MFCFGEVTFWQSLSCEISKNTELWWHFWRCSPHPTPTSLSPCPEGACVPQTLTALHAPGHSRVGSVLSQDIAMMNSLVLCTCIMNESWQQEERSVVSALCVGCLCAVEPPLFCCWGQRWPWHQLSPEPQTGCSGDFCNTSF